MSVKCVTPYTPLSCTKSGVCRGHVYLLFLFLINILFCVYSVEPPRRYGTKGVPTINVLSKIIKMSKYSMKFLILLSKQFYVHVYCMGKF